MTVVPISLNLVAPASWWAPDGIQWYNTFGDRTTGDLLLSHRIRVDNTSYGQSPIVYGGSRANATRIDCLSGDQYGNSSGSRVLLQWDKAGSKQPLTRFSDMVPGTEDWYAFAILVPSGQPGAHWVFNEIGHPPTSLVGGFIVQQATPKLTLNSGSHVISLSEASGVVSAANPDGTILRITPVFTFHDDTWVRIVMRCVWSITSTGRIQVWISESATMPALTAPTFDTAVAYGGEHDTLQSYAGAPLGSVPAARGIYRSNKSPGFTSTMYDGGMVIADSYAECVASFESGEIAMALTSGQRQVIRGQYVDALADLACHFTKTELNAAADAADAWATANAASYNTALPASFRTAASAAEKAALLAFVATARSGG